MTRRVFYTVLCAELASLALCFVLLQGRSGYGAFYGYLFLWPTLGLGLANALVASRGRPRWNVAVVVSVLHGPATVWLLLILASELEQSATSDAEYDEQLRDEQNRKRWAAELNSLVLAKRYADARTYIREHPMLTASDDETFRAALCPRDGSEPDFALLRALGERGAPSGNDRLMEAAKCSLSAFQMMMRVSSQPADAVASDGRTALMTATDPALLDYLLAQGLDVNARDSERRTPLMYHRTADVTRTLLDHGADPKALDEKRRSALHFGGPEDELGGIYELLLNAGADPNQLAALGTQYTKEYTPLVLMACLENRWSQAAADALVAHGAREPDRPDAICCIIGTHPIDAALRWPGLDLDGAGGASLLIRAIDSGQHEIIRQLLEAGVNPLAKDENGRTGLAYYRDTYQLDPQFPIAKLMLDAVERFTLMDAGP